MTEYKAKLDSIYRTVADVCHYIDGKKWDALLSLYADEVETDYTSLFGGTPLKQKSSALINGWRTVLAGVSTQHLLGPILIDLEKDGACGRCHVRAMHFAPGAPSGEHWEVLGHYVFKLVERDNSWRITSMTLETLMQIGNVKLLQEASQTNIISCSEIIADS